jgi:hypothetical protein
MKVQRTHTANATGGRKNLTLGELREFMKQCAGAPDSAMLWGKIKGFERLFSITVKAEFEDPEVHPGPAEETETDRMKRNIRDKFPPDGNHALATLVQESIEHTQPFPPFAKPA